MGSSAVWWGIIIYTAVSLYIAYLSRSGKETSMSGYFLGNRNMNGFVSALSYSATTYSAFMLVGLAGLTYRGGVGALGFEVIYFVGVTLVAFFGPRFWLVGKKFGYVTPSEMLGDRYNNKSVATVNYEGWIVGITPGECTITVYSAVNPEIKAEIKVIVKEK